MVLGPVDVVLLEGWCLGFRPVDPQVCGVRGGGGGGGWAPPLVSIGRAVREAPDGFVCPGDRDCGRRPVWDGHGGGY